MQVVVVESPAKAKTINKYLGDDYIVLASFGHIRDLPSKDGSVRPDQDFEMSWELDGDAERRVRDIAKALKGADRLILATDPDREGEAISWHVLEVLREKKALGSAAVERVVFNEITKSAILAAMKKPRQIDNELVDAYLARRALDYLVGFTLSPVLWRKLPGARSAGRVQSVALRLICDRELDIERFRTQEYWTIDGLFNADGTDFKARLARLDGKKVEKFTIGNQTGADAAVAKVKSASFTVGAVDTNPAKRHPYAPFTTSTLQQEASRKLGFSAQRTMQIAQKLYEGVDLGGETVGLITYMRTDGVSIAEEAIRTARNVIAQDYGENYVPAAPRIYKAKAKNAQEAHEAIRPTNLARRPNSVAHALDADQRRLYQLVWERTIASQMASAELMRTTIELDSADRQIGLRATGTVQIFDGFLRLYQEGRDDTLDDDEDSRRLPKVAVGQQLNPKAVLPEQHFTEPPPRYSEATLVKKLEELGIGRPSTYASILTVLRERNYVRMDKNRFIPEDKGRLVTAFLESFFRRYVEYDFTARLEEQLDDVSAGKIGWKEVLREFWTAFFAAVDGTKELRTTQVLEALNELLGPHIFPDKGDGSNPRACPTCGTGTISLKLGKFGAFIGCSNYPDCKYTRQLGAGDGDSAGESADRQLGVDPVTGHPVWLKNGRFGWYVELDDPALAAAAAAAEPADAEAPKKGKKAKAPAKPKPKRSSIPKDISPDAITLDQAVALLNLPRVVGDHPETGKPIAASIGRFGPYLSHDGKFVSLKGSEDLFTIGINRAVDLLAQPKFGKGRSAPEALREVGAHPADGAPVKVMAGRFGPYVTHGGVNATLPKAATPEAITLDEAVALLAARAAAGGGKKKGRAPARKAAPKKAAASAAKPAAKATAKKPAAKKAAKKPAAKKAAS